MTPAIEGPLVSQQTGPACERILRALPDWFGIESAVVQYASDVCNLPTWLAMDEDGACGFVSIKQHNPYAAEVYVMGVLPGSQRAGIGRALLQCAEAYLRQAGVAYLQVKTLASSHPDPFYARTRAFYQSMGFRPLEEFPQLWGPENPCLIMIKHLNPPLMGETESEPGYANH